MAKAKKIKQLSFMVPDKPGQLSEITSALAEAKVNISNICAYGMEGQATFMLTTDSNAKAKKAVSRLDEISDMKEYDVIEVEMPNKPGELKKTAETLAGADINIIYLYGTTSTGRTATGIFLTSDNAKAIRLINRTK